MTTKLGPNQQKWVNALRSGEFKQCEGQLEFKGGFCCLGVACKVAEKEGIEVDKDCGQLKGISLRSQLDVKKWLGMKDDEGWINEDLNYLSGQNDHCKKGFHQIADIIEQNAHLLFEEPR